MEEVMTFQAQGTVLNKLKQLGINEEQLALMPDALKVPLFRGEVTPVFMANMETSNGKVIQLPMKAQFVRDDNEQVLLMTYPLRREIANELGLTKMSSNGCCLARLYARKWT